jgi:hypothetical protein
VSSPSVPNVTLLNNLQQAALNVSQLLVTLTTNPKPTYSINGQNVPWTEYYRELIQRQKDLNELIQIAGGVFELQTIMLPAGNANGGGGVGGGFWP